MIAALRAAIEGVKQRGQTDLGDKTLLDALAPAVDELEKAMAEGAPDALARAAATGREAAEATKGMLAQRGRAKLHGRAQPRLRRRGCDRRCGDARGSEQGLAGGWTRAGLTGSARLGRGDHLRGDAVKKFVNDAQQFVPEMLKGVELANPTRFVTCRSTT